MVSIVDHYNFYKTTLYLKYKSSLIHDIKGEIRNRFNLHPIQTGSRLPGTVWRGLIFFTTDRPDYHRMPPPAGDNHGWVVFAVRTGFALGHRASTFHACTHLITTAVRYQLRAQGRYFVPEPNMVGGVTGRSPGERPHDGIAGESPA